jgi:hypothetical protein
MEIRYGSHRIVVREPGGGKAPVFSAMAKNQPAEFAAVRNREHAQSARSFAAMKSR